MEPPRVKEARRIVALWGGREGHDTYYDCLDGGWKGFQGACFTCGWRGPEHLRGDEEMGTPESRAHKQRAKQDAAQHRLETAYDFSAAQSEQKEG